MNDKKSIIFLLDLKVRQYYNSKNKSGLVDSLLKKIEQLSLSESLDVGLCLYYQLKWLINRFKGRRKEGSKAIELAYKFLEQGSIDDKYTYYGCKYAYALELWLEYRNYDSASLIEECCEYFYSNCFYHGLVMGLGILMIIYQQTQNKEKSMELAKKIIGKGDFPNKLPEEVKAIICYFSGSSNKLCFNLKNSENYLLETQNILRPIYQNSTYSGYYLRGLAHLTACYALQGKLELAYNQMKEVEELIEEGIATRNLDTFGKNQIYHDFNLTRFYIHSRLQGFQIEQLNDLIQDIIDNLDKQHSDAVFFSEFLLNANLFRDQLLEIKNLNNPSTKRVEHIINFLLEKTTYTEEKQIMDIVSTLRRRPVAERMTLVERAFADLLAAQEYYRIGRFAEIYPLLRKYKSQLNNIEVLELRIFMEAFIQIGAYKNGDPLGPALQYMAIKNCRYYGFSRLESKLLNYLDMQAKEAFSR